MWKRRSFSAVLITLTLALAVYLLYGHSHRQNVSMHVGETMREVLAHNRRANYSPDAQDDNTPIIWPVDDTSSESFDMTYDDAGRNLRFPQAKLVWAKQYAGVVTNILISTSASKLPLTVLYKDLQQTADSLRQAGWLMQGTMPSLERLRSGVSALQTDQVEGTLLQFSKGSVSAYLKIKGFSVEAGKKSQDSVSYILDVEFSDSALQDTQQNKTYAERIRVNGSISKSLKLSYWLNRSH